MPHTTSICVLTRDDLARYRQTGELNCRHHAHVSLLVARQMQCKGDAPGPWHQPVASYVDSRRIVLKTEKEWRSVNQTNKRNFGPGAPVMQLVDGAPAVTRPAPVRRFDPPGVPVLAARRRTFHKYRRTLAFSV